MVIVGAWVLGDDEVLRPVIRSSVLAEDGSWLEVPLVVDTGADRTVFSQAIYKDLGSPESETSDPLEGAGGETPSVVFRTEVVLPCHDGGRASFRGPLAAFTDLTALDMSVLGRDILNHFAVIVDYPRDIVCLLGKGHQYVIQVV